MTPYLLISLLIVGVVESQTGNVTSDRNQTFNTANSTVEYENVTFSLSKNEKSRIKNERENNQTFTITTEDDENFQMQGNQFPFRECNQEFLAFTYSKCNKGFRSEMMSISTENWCLPENILRPYNDMTLCLEWCSHLAGCHYPNPDVHGIFLNMHSYYFHNCSKQELLLDDVPDTLVIVLTVVPISIIPVLVYLVIFKNKTDK